MEAKIQKRDVVNNLRATINKKDIEIIELKRQLSKCTCKRDKPELTDDERKAKAEAKEKRKQEKLDKKQKEEDEKHRMYEAIERLTSDNSKLIALVKQ